MPQAESNPNEEAYTPQEIIKALHEAKGFVSAAAKIIGCSIPTIYNYINRHDIIKDALDKERADSREKMIDIAEKTLWEKVSEGNMTAIIFFLKCQAKDRGYSERYQITGKDDKEIAVKLTDAEVNVNIINKLKKLSNGNSKKF